MEHPSLKTLNLDGFWVVGGAAEFYTMDLSLGSRYSSHLHFQRNWFYSFLFFAAHSALKVYVPMLQMRQVANGSRPSKSKAQDLKGMTLLNHSISLVDGLITGSYILKVVDIFSAIGINDT